MAILSVGTVEIPFQPNLLDLNRLNIPLLGQIPKYATSAPLVKWDINAGGAQAVGNLVTSDVTVFSGDVILPAKLGIADFRLESSFTINEVQATQAAALGIDALSNLINLSSQGAIRSLMKKLGGLIYTGIGDLASGGIVGLNTTISTVVNNLSTTPYAGVAPTGVGAVPKWTSTVIDPFGAITRRKMQMFASQIYEGTYSDVMGQYDRVVMRGSMAVEYEDVFYKQAVLQVTPQTVADLGTHGRSFENIPIIEDPNCPDGTVYFINTADLRFYSFKQIQGPSFSDEKPIEGLLFYAKQLPSKNPQDLYFALFGMFQLAIMDRSSVSAMKNVLTDSSGLMIGAPAQAWTITALSGAAGDYTVVIDGTTVTFTAVATTAALVATGLMNAINANATVAAKVTASDQNGALFTIRNDGNTRYVITVADTAKLALVNTLP